jgi:hypothetical protein
MLEWIERYGCHTAKLPVGTLHVEWCGDGYSVRVFGATYRDKSQTLEAGKARAVDGARRLLAQSLKMLPE